MMCDDCGSMVQGKWFDEETLPVELGTDPDGYDRDFSYCPVCGAAVED